MSMCKIHIIFFELIVKSIGLGLHIHVGETIKNTDVRAGYDKIYI